MADRKGRRGKKDSRFRPGRQKKERIYPEYTGRVQMTREGYIFVIVDDLEDDVFVKASKTMGALNGDTVRVAVTKEKTETRRMEGKVMEIVSRSPRPFVGILHVVGNQAWVLMQSRVMPYDIGVSVEDAARKGAVSGMKVAAVVDGWPKGAPNPLGHIVDVLGEPGENDTEMHAILAEYALPYRFEPEVENAADGISEEITDRDRKERRDFSGVLTFTIDPADAKDFDDALSFRTLENGNYEVGVHIADVTHYVHPGSVVDEEAKTRSTSVYLVDRTVPMLPEKLSNKLCSLRPGEPKLTFSAVFEITPLGRIASQWFGRTIITSDYRFAYETAQQIIDAGQKAMKMELRGGTDGKAAAGDADVPDRDGSAMGEGITSGMIIPDELKAAVLTLNNLALKFRKKRFAAGAISFERPEMKVEVDEKGRPVRVYQKVSKEANWLIEEFMLLANRSVAEYVARQKKTFVYRVHDEPNQDKLENLRSFIHNFGYTLGPTNSGKEISRELNGLFAAAKDKPEFNAIELLSLRTMAKARYDTENIGHYGLAFKYYTHFTSPIRRYPDMMVHRLLAKYLAGAESQKKDFYDVQCKYCSEREVVAAEAERSSIKYKLVEFMQDKVGYEFEGHISGLTEWGMYVEIEPTKIEGMVALRDIRSDYFEFDEERYRIVGRHSHIVYNLGDPVKIRVKKTNLEQKLLDYELVETGLETREERQPAAPVQGANKAARKEKVRKAIAASKKKAARKGRK
ncbi:MAG: RNB domain-containing ribonuclease [Bacteroidetes bacterium]|uniref:Ribonuclease R n=1 Tax=Candidatus Cryptobacteroides intestinavium TaxID=2840766 RepID=A0A9D9ET90_9BACT|nr:RNB domain-containing ribonuclease [Candidatus Cryptobacteroides intestinavium]